jgi:hypothetical protein
MGLEPMTLGLLDPRSNQLSYKSCVVQTKKSGQGPGDLDTSALNFNLKCELLLSNDDVTQNKLVNFVQVLKRDVI